jgi:hypothetical protein
MRSFTPTRRSASHTQACDAAITVTPNSCSSTSMASITGECGERRAGVADAGAVAVDFAAGRWLAIDHSCPVPPATARNTVTDFAADDTRNLARCDRTPLPTDVHAIGERHDERCVRAVAQSIGCRRLLRVVGRRAGRSLSARGRRRSGQDRHRAHHQRRRLLHRRRHGQTRV